jgi:hypothetical protein
MLGQYFTECPVALHFGTTQPTQLISVIEETKKYIYIKYYAMKAYWGVDVYIHVFLTSALVGNKWSASCPGNFIPGERAPETHWIRSWVGPRTGLDDKEKRKFLPVPRLEF